MTRAADAWLFVLEEGSACAKQIETHLGVAHDYFTGGLWLMQKRGLLERIEKDPNDSTSRVRFTVTGDCIVPQGIKLKDILK